MYHLIVVRPEPPGQYTARVVSFPEVSAVAATEPEAIEQSRQALAKWLSTARLVQVEAPAPVIEIPGLNESRHRDPNDPVERMYQEELARFRREDLERTLREEEVEGKLQRGRAPMHQLIVVRPEPPGQYTAQVVALPEIRAVAGTSQEAVEQARTILAEWLATGRLVPVEVPVPLVDNPALKFAGHARDDPDFDRYVEEIRRYRQEVDERECSNSSSTPTT